MTSSPDKSDSHTQTHTHAVAYTHTTNKNSNKYKQMYTDANEHELQPKHELEHKHEYKHEHEKIPLSKHFRKWSALKPYPLSVRVLCWESPA